MQTRTYGDLYKLVQSLAGVRAFAKDEQDDIANCINRRLHEAYETSQVWPRYLVPHEARTVGSFAVRGSAGEAAGEGSNQVYQRSNNPINEKDAYTGLQDADYSVSWSGSQWELKKVGAVQFTNPEDTDQPWQATEPWTATGGSGFLYLSSGNYVPYRQVGRAETIGEFIRLHQGQPFVNDSRREYDFYVTEYGAQILNLQGGNNHAGSSAAPTVFVSYKKPLALLTTANNYPESTEPVPAEFFYYVAHTTYADFLRLDGQTDKALVEEQRGNGYLTLQLERIETISNNNSINQKFSTYVSRAAR
jgi:hypothetical protein